MKKTSTLFHCSLLSGEFEAELASLQSPARENQPFKTSEVSSAGGPNTIGKAKMCQG